MKSTGFLRSSNHLRTGGAMVAALLFMACSTKLTIEMPAPNDSLRFEVTEANSWQTQSQSRAAGDVAADTEHAEVLMLQGENPSDTLFLHTTVSEGIESAHRGGSEVPLTRAKPVDETTFYDSFGVLTYAYIDSWSESSCLPNYMYNVEVTKASSWTTSYYWPGNGYHVRFFAYAPYNGQNIVLSDKTIAGTPTIKYVVPAAVADQNDLLIAASAEMEGNASSAAPLNFVHALTAVRFTTGEDMMAGRITKITLKGVYGSAAYALGSTAWSDHAVTTDFSQTLSVVADGSQDQEITPAEGTFMMLPQTLPEGASVEVVYTDNLTSTRRTLTASLAGNEWPMGKTVIYRISTTSISVTPDFSVTIPADFTYKGGSKSYSVTSSASVSRPGNPTKTVILAWSADFVDDDGAGGYNVIPRPDWLTDFTTSDNGSTSASEYTAKITAQQGITSNRHLEALQEAAPVSGTYDLSTEGDTKAMNTANCYLVNAPGSYSLPLVYGNAIKDGETNSSAYSTSVVSEDILSVMVNHLDADITDPYIYNNANCTPADATLIWQDEENMVTGVSLSDDKKSLTFEVEAATIRQGNAIVAVRDESNRIMWSWHIWVTDYKLSDVKTVTNAENIKYKMMLVNVGWCDVATTAYDARSVKVRFTQAETNATQVITLTQAAYTTPNTGNQVYFQFGRKDPMLGAVPNASSTFIDKSCYSDNYAFGLKEGQVTIGKSIQNPHSFYNYGVDTRSDWCSFICYNRWSADNKDKNIDNPVIVKTIYDPSPVGFHLPAMKAYSGFTAGGDTANGLPSYGSKYNSPYKSAADFDANFGWVFYCNKMTGVGGYDPSGGTITLPRTGSRNQSTGKVERSDRGIYWTVMPNGIGYGRYMTCYESYVAPTSNNSMTFAYAVRPIGE